MKFRLTAPAAVDIFALVLGVWSSFAGGGERTSLMSS